MFFFKNSLGLLTLMDNKVTKSAASLREMHLDRFKKSSLFLLEYFSRLISIVNMKGIIMFPPVTVILGKYSIRKHLKISLNLELLSIPIGSFKFSWQLITRWNFARSKLAFLTRSKLFQKHSQDQNSHF